MTSTAFRVTVAIPMRPHLLEFIKAKEHLPEGVALALPNRDSVVLDYLCSLFENKTAVRDYPQHRLPETYTARLEVLLTEGRLDSGLIFLSDTRIIRFNNFVHRYMHDLLFERIAENLDLGIDEKETIYLFINRYRLYDLNFEALKRASTRYRERKHLPILSRKNRFFSQKMAV